MLAFNEEQSAQLPALREKALANGVTMWSLCLAEVAKRMEPNISAAVLGGLVIPRESIVDPFTTSIAYAEVAVENGVDVVFGMAVPTSTMRARRSRQLSVKTRAASLLAT